MAIRVEGLSKSFGDFEALKNVSLDIPDGEQPQGLLLEPVPSSGNTSGGDA